MDSTIDKAPTTYVYCGAGPTSEFFSKCPCCLQKSLLVPRAHTINRELSLYILETQCTHNSANRYSLEAQHLHQQRKVLSRPRPQLQRPSVSLALQIQVFSLTSKSHFPPPYSYVEYFSTANISLSCSHGAGALTQCRLPASKPNVHGVIDRMSN